MNNTKESQEKYFQQCVTIEKGGGEGGKQAPERGKGMEGERERGGGRRIWPQPGNSLKKSFKALSLERNESEEKLPVSISASPTFFGSQPQVFPAKLLSLSCVGGSRE